MSRLRRKFLAAAVAAGVVATLVNAPAAHAAGPNLAAGKTFSASSVSDVYGAGNAGDGNASTYWESSNNAFPQWLQVDLGTATQVNQVVLKLPPATAWATRTQTLTVQGSTTGSSFSTLKASAGYTFNPAGGNAVTVDFTAASARFVRLSFTGNTGWPAGQLSELEVYGPVSGGGDTQAPGAPGNLAFTQPATDQIRLTWSASTDNVGVTGYDVLANGVLRTSLAGNVLSYTDTQPAGATVSYQVRAKDAAGNVSAPSNTVTRNGTTAPGSNLAQGKPIEASSTVHTFVAANANDNNTATYWEGNGFPATLTVKLGSNASVSSVVVKLNPDSSWGSRQQTFAILGREQSSSTFTTIVGAASYSFNPASGNTVTVPVSATAADLRLSFTANSGSPSGQVAELQVNGVAAPNPDLTVTSTSVSPAAPVETDAVTLSATVRNAGGVGSAASNVNFYLGTTKVGTATVGALAAGAQTTVSANIGARNAGSYQVVAKVDESNTIIESNEANNSYTSPSNLVVTPVSSSDLVASVVSWSPGTPAAGQTVTFSVTLKNQGSAASAGGAHGVTLTVLNGSSVVRTLTGSWTGTLAAGASSPAINLGTWTAANGRYTVRTVIANDANELPVKQTNNTSDKSFFVGRGANMPYDMYEAEDGQTGGGAAVVGPNRTVGDLAGEASGRRAVTLNQTGAYVQWTTRAATNTVVARFSIPDGTSSSINVYVNGTLNKTLPLTSKYAWLYGNETAPQNSGTGPRHIYDEANILLNGSFPAGSTIKLQKDGANPGSIAIDFINLEQVAPKANPDAARYVVPNGFDQQAVQNALDTARQDTTKLGVYLPAGDYQTSNKFQVYGKSIRVVGAGPWYTRFYTPSTQSETDAGFRADSTANGSTFADFAFFGNYTIRIDGPGKVFDFANTAGITIDNIWTEHVVCLYWGANTDNMVIKNSRIRNTFADGVNMTNGSTGNLVDNNEARATGDDSFALFSAIDAGGSDEINNVYSNLTSILTWRAAGLAVYGGYANTFKNIYIADTLVYSGITISSLDFGYPMNGFGANPPTVFDNISIVRAGGHFWGNQVFPAIWVFSASKVFQGIRVSNVDIVDPTYSGIMFQTNYVGGQPQNIVKDTVFTNVTITGAQRSGDAYDAKSGYAIWANPMPETGQGPAVGSATFTNLQLSNNYRDIENPTSTFTIIRN
ncbi:discoidin domain-containing protein [Actinoplanes sp. M2I2]|uniref:discoidin domain-containing protein n=1 Tax=Actinoplanes sp. M2I2 TaxID=1734444 RepID=UPI0020225475|nr:discoidin domain-containing protein [Actinoplanes sp. M2I2]